jgi:methionyl-tRNA formyltransferase
MANSQAGLRLVFAGTPDFAALHLDALLGSSHQLLAAYTQPDRPAGRGKKLKPSPVKTLALANEVQVHQPISLRDATAQAELKALQPDLLVVVAYGLILPQAVLDIPSRGCLNVHASLLPRWRGAAPIQRAIEAGDEESGITIMQMDAGLDTGDMLASCQLPIAGDTSAASLHDQLAAAGAPLLIQVLDALAEYQAHASPQPETGATYAHKIEKAEAQLDWSQSAQTLLRKILAFNPFPIAWTLLGDDRLKIWNASCCEGQGKAGEILQRDAQGVVVACGDGALRLQQLQLPGGRPMAAAELLKARAERFAIGVRLGA